MNVYDFDGTVYKGDSSIDFYLYCLRSKPRIISALWKQLIGVMKYRVLERNTTKMKESFFSFLRYLDSPSSMVEKFWDSKEKNIASWYIVKKEKSDLIVSASPKFLVEPICRRLGIREPIATIMDISNGEIMGSNCKGTEKVRRYKEQYSSEPIVRFYSDSNYDEPLANIAECAFFVHGENVCEWIKERGR